MEKKYVLKMNFKNEEGRQTTLTIKNIKESLPKADVDAAMEAILQNNIFTSAGGDFVSIVDAEIIETTKKPIRA